MLSSLRSCLLVGTLALAAACSPSQSPTEPESSAAGTLALAKPGTDEPLPATTSLYSALPEEMRTLLDEPFTGDLQEMVLRRLIRAGVVFNRTQYFIDKGVQRGISYESMKLFEEELNKRLKTGRLRVRVVIIPMEPNQLGPALQSGKVDMVAATLTITPERRKVASFSIPTRRHVSEIVVTSADAPPVATVDDLSGRKVIVRRSSAYFSSLQMLNRSLEKRGRPLVTIIEAPESLQDDDLLEMMNAGLIQTTIVDDFIAKFWYQVFPNIRLHEGVAVRTGGEIGVAVRKNNPRLLRAINTWIKEYGPGTAFGNMMEHRYLESTTYVRNAADDTERRKLASMVTLFQTYANQYKVDYLLMAAQGYQESGLDQSARSNAGAIGVMQVMPTTGKQLAVGDIRRLEPNIHAGVKYFRFMIDVFYKDDPMDPFNKALMTLASYNAGPNRIRRLRAEAAARGLDPNVWFGNVEHVVSERIGRETVTYVSNIHKYYVAYRLSLAEDEARRHGRDALSQRP